MVKKTAEYRLNRIKSSNQFRYYISFRDGRNTLCEVEVSREVFQAIETFGKVERNQTRWNERHIEQSELSEATFLVGRCGASLPSKLAKRKVKTGNQQLTGATKAPAFFISERLYRSNNRVEGGMQPAGCCTIVESGKNSYP